MEENIMERRKIELPDICCLVLGPQGERRDLLRDLWYSAYSSVAVSFLFSVLAFGRENPFSRESLSFCTVRFWFWGIKHRDLRGGHWFQEVRSEIAPQLPWGAARGAEAHRRRRQVGGQHSKQLPALTRSSFHLAGSPGPTNSLRAPLPHALSHQQKTTALLCLSGSGLHGGTSLAAITARASPAALLRAGDGGWKRKPQTSCSSFSQERGGASAPRGEQTDAGRTPPPPRVHTQLTALLSQVKSWCFCRHSHSKGGLSAGGLSALLWLCFPSWSQLWHYPFPVTSDQTKNNPLKNDGDSN